MTTHLNCKCGQVSLTVEREPIITAECHCTSCRTAGARLATLPGAGPVVEPNGGTYYVMYRKDRVTFTKGMDKLREFHLPGSSTRRVVATCCNTPVFLEFKGGHWLSLYKGLWPDGTLPALDIRTQVSDLPDPSALDDSVPSGPRQTWGFYGRLLGAWIGMGFRTPKVAVSGELGL